MGAKTTGLGPKVPAARSAPHIGRACAKSPKIRPLRTIPSETTAPVGHDLRMRQESHAPVKRRGVTSDPTLSALLPTVRALVMAFFCSPSAAPAGRWP